MDTAVVVVLAGVTIVAVSAGAYFLRRRYWIQWTRIYHWIDDETEVSFFLCGVVGAVLIVAGIVVLATTVIL